MGRIKEIRKRSLNRSTTWREFELIEWIRSITKKNSKYKHIGIGDDAAAYPPEPHVLELITSDALVENVHWSFNWCDPQALGHKAAAVSLSDIAAMGGRPRRAFLTLALPRQISVSDIQCCVKAMMHTFASYGAELAGGDTVLSPGPMMITMTVQGTVAQSEIKLRSGARPGDMLFVTGELGSAAAGLALLKKCRKIPHGCQSLVKKILTPIPRVIEGRQLAGCSYVRAMLDLSDGLAAGLRFLAQASKVGIKLHTSKVPISPAVRRAASRLGHSSLDWAMSGGEDYELLFTAPAQYARVLQDMLIKKSRTPCHIIGEVVSARQGVYQILPDGSRAPLPPAWEHGA